MSELKEKYIQLCCDFYNEHANEDKIWFGRMFDDCHQEHNKRNSSMYRWQFPLMILKSQQAEINQHQLEIHALGEANLNQAMMLAKKQEEIDSLKAQLKKWKGQSLAAMLHGACQCGEPWESVVSDKEGFNQLHCFNCNHDRYENKEYFGDHEPKALRGEHE